MITVIILRGCGEQVGNRDSLLWWVANRLDPKRFETQECAYPASIGPTNPNGDHGGMSLERSGEVAYPMLDDMIQATPNEAMLIGYSQGAWTGSRFLERRKHGLHPKCSVPWAVFFANPLRPAGVSHDVPGAPGFGLAGQRERIPGVDIREVAHPEDGITCCPWNSRLRTVADIVDPLSFALGGGWFQGLAEKTMRGDWQQVLTSWRPGMPLPDPGEFALRYWRDAQLVDGYLRTGKHGASYWTDGLLQRAVDHINERVRG